MAPNPEPPQYLVAHIRDELAHDERVAAQDIDVRIVGSDVFVTGAVTTAARRDDCELVLRELLPEHTVHCALVLLEQEAPTGAEELS